MRFQIGCINTYGWGHQMMLNFVRNCFPEQATSTFRVQGRPPTSRALLQQPLPTLHSPRALVAKRREWAPRPARALPSLLRAWQRMEGKPTGTPTSPHQPPWGPTCPTGQPGIQAGGWAGSHPALPSRHPGQVRRERRPDFRGLGPTAGAEGGPAPPPLPCFLPKQRGCSSPVISALLHACTARTHCGCPPSAEGRLRPRRETLCPPRSSWGRTPGLASRASGLLEGPGSHRRERGTGGQRPNVGAAQGSQAPRQSGLPELGGP